MSSSDAKFIGYDEFLKSSTIPSVRPCIWKSDDIKQELDKSLDKDFMGPGRGAVSLVNKGTGDSNSVSPNINALVQVFKPGERSNPHKHSNMAIFIVFEGEGESIVDGEKIEWAKGDVFFAPAFLSHEHLNTSKTENAILYTIQDVPTVAGMGAWFLEEPVGTEPKHVIAGVGTKGVLPDEGKKQ